MSGEQPPQDPKPATPDQLAEAEEAITTQQGADASGDRAHVEDVADKFEALRQALEAKQQQGDNNGGDSQ